MYHHPCPNEAKADAPSHSPHQPSPPRPRERTSVELKDIVPFHHPHQPRRPHPSRPPLRIPMISLPMNQNSLSRVRQLKEAQTLTSRLYLLEGYHCLNQDLQRLPKYFVGRNSLLVPLHRVLDHLSLALLHLCLGGRQHALGRSLLSGLRRSLHQHPRLLRNNL